MLAVASLRDRWPSFVGTLVALTLGVGLLTATLLVLNGSRPRLPPAYAAAEVLVARTDPVLPPWSPEAAEELAGRLGRVGSVQGVVIDRSFYAQVVLGGRAYGDPNRGPDGHGWSVARLAGRPLVAGRGPVAAGDVVVPAGTGLVPGDPVTILTATGPRSFTVTGIGEGSGIYVDDLTARDLAGGVRVIGLLTPPGADVAALASAARSIVGESGQVLHGPDRTELEPARDRQIRSDAATLLGILVGLSAFVCIFVVASTFAFGVAARRRELALLRTIGATPGQVRRLLLGQAGLVGLVASAIGVGLGAAAIEPYAQLLQRARLLPPGIAVETPRWVLATSAGVGLAVALAGVWSATRRASRVAPLEALRVAAVERRPMTPVRWVLGLAFAAIGVAMVWTSAASTADAAVTIAIFSAMAMIVGLTLLAPVVVTPVVWLVTRPFAGLAGSTTLLVREGTRVAVRRVASTAAPVIATVGFTTLLTGMYATLHTFDVAEEARALPSASVVVPDGTPGLSDAVPGAATAELRTSLYATAADGEAHRLEADGVDPGSIEHELGADTIIVTSSTADDLGWQIGAEVVVVFADGRSAPLRVVTVLVDEVVPGDVLLNRDVARAHDPSALVSMVLADGPGHEQRPGRLDGLGARFVSAAEYVNATSAADWRMVRLSFMLLIGVSVGYTAIAIANTLMMATAGRRREFATLRLAGATSGQVLRVVAAEAGLVVAIGGLLGLAAAVTALLGIVSGLRDYLPETPLVLPVEAVAGVAGICLSLALAASLVPAWLMLRQSGPTVATVD